MFAVMNRPHARSISREQTGPNGWLFRIKQNMINAISNVVLNRPLAAVKRRSANAINPAHHPAATDIVARTLSAANHIHGNGQPDFVKAVAQQPGGEWF